MVESIRIAELRKRAFCGICAGKCFHSVLLPEVDRFQNDIPVNIRAALVGNAALVWSYNFAAWVIWERLNLRKAELMTEPNNRVLTRRGARILTEEEMGQIGGAFSSSVIITDVLTNFGKDFSVDHLEN
jgi:hypothetical protein